MLHISVTILISSIFYVAFMYYSYVSVWILYKGIKYRLLAPTIKSMLFILLGYVSIITDIILFSNGSFTEVVIKNGFLLLLSVTSFIIANR